jgi:hypothetical protein
MAYRLDFAIIKNTSTNELAIKYMTEFQKNLVTNYYTSAVYCNSLYKILNSILIETKEFVYFINQLSDVENFHLIKDTIIVIHNFFWKLYNKIRTTKELLINNNKKIRSKDIMVIDEVKRRNVPKDVQNREAVRDIFDGYLELIKNMKSMIDIMEGDIQRSMHYARNAYDQIFDYILLMNRNKLKLDKHKVDFHIYARYNEDCIIEEKGYSLNYDRLILSKKLKIIFQHDQTNFISDVTNFENELFENIFCRTKSIFFNVAKEDYVLYYQSKFIKYKIKDTPIYSAVSYDTKFKFQITNTNNNNSTKKRNFNDDDDDDDYDNQNTSLDDGSPSLNLNNDSSLNNYNLNNQHNTKNNNCEAELNSVVIMPRKIVKAKQTKNVQQESAKPKINKDEDDELTFNNDKELVVIRKYDVNVDENLLEEVETQKQVNDEIIPINDEGGVNNSNSEMCVVIYQQEQLQEINDPNIMNITVMNVCKQLAEASLLNDEVENMMFEALMQYLQITKKIPENEIIPITELFNMIEQEVYGKLLF